MKSHPPRVADYPVRRPLDRSSVPPDWVVAHRYRRSGQLYVLKWIRGSNAPPFNELASHSLDLASLSHPSLALPQSIGRDAETGLYFYLRPYVEGTNIGDAALGREPQEILVWFVLAAEALACLHRFGFPHRDLRPSKVLVTRSALHGRRLRGPAVVLCDPSLRKLPDNSSAGLSSDVASDVYALGKVFTIALTGREPEIADNGFPLSIADRGDRVSVDLDRLVMKLLHPDPQRRYRDVNDLLVDLRRLAKSRVTRRVVPADCFLGREEELEFARDALFSAARPTALAISGQAGIGKSAVLRRVALEAQARGYRVVSLRCYAEQPDSRAVSRALSAALIPHGHAGKLLRAQLRRIFHSNATVDSEESSEHRLFLRSFLDWLATAAREVPTIVLLDEAHLADSLTVEVLEGLVRDIASRRSSASDGSSSVGGVPPSVVVSFRRESPFLKNIQTLLRTLESLKEVVAFLELQPLPHGAVQKWLRCTFASEQHLRTLRDFARRSRGHPLTIREALRNHSKRPHEPFERVLTLDQFHQEFFSVLELRLRRLLEKLAVLGRPASLDLLSSLLSDEGVGESVTAHAIETLVEDGIIAIEDDAIFFQQSSFHSWLLESLGERRRELHGQVACTLERDPLASAAELAHHWIQSDEPDRSYPHSLTAARELVRNHEHRRALAFYDAATSSLSNAEAELRNQVDLEFAEALGRAGEHRKAVDILQGALGRQKRDRDDFEMSLHGQIGIHCHRAGEMSQAVFHLEKCLQHLRDASAGTPLLTRVRIESELVEIASNQGEYDRAESLCRGALRRIENAGDEAKDLSFRRVEMILHENLGHLHLRRFRFEDALSGFERSLQVGDRLGPMPEKSLILNNLGILYIQQNRFAKAVSAYR